MLSDFASTMLTHSPIHSILDHLVEKVTEALPITAVGTTLISRESAAVRCGF
jgi:hypothetical protein